MVKPYPSVWESVCKRALTALIRWGQFYFIWYDFYRFYYIDWVSHRNSLTIWVSNRNTQFITSLKQTRSHCRHPIQSVYSKISVKPLVCKSPLYIWENGGLRAIVHISQVLQYFCIEFLPVVKKILKIIKFFLRAQLFFGSPCNLVFCSDSTSNFQPELFT